uniref:Ovule protein n=1 Tax=Mesocestoides corti TaxID=53468 RepID=A0A5K3FXM3_MESCO
QKKRLFDKLQALHPSPPRWPRRSLFTASHSCPYLVGCISSSRAIGTQRDTGLADASVQYVC